MGSPVRFAVVRKLLEEKGYVLDRVSGSHFIFKKAGCEPIVIPVHRNQVKYGYYKKALQAP